MCDVMYVRCEKDVLECTKERNSLKKGRTTIDRRESRGTHQRAKKRVSHHCAGYNMMVQVLSATKTGHLFSLFHVIKDNVETYTPGFNPAQSAR